MEKFTLCENCSHSNQIKRITIKDYCKDCKKEYGRVQRKNHRIVKNDIHNNEVRLLKQCRYYMYYDCTQLLVITYKNIV